MKKSLLFLLGMVFTASAYSQKDLDSLLLIAESDIEPDTSVINSINDYTYGMYRTYPEIVKRIAYKILEASEEADYIRGQAVAQRRIGGTNYVLGKSSEVIDSQLKAIALFEQMGDTAKVLGSWNNIGLAYIQIGEYEKAKETFKNALDKASSEDHYFIAVLYNNLGITHDRLDQPDSSLYYNNLALDIRLEFHHPKRRLQATYTNLGSLYHTYANDLNKAILLTQKAIEINHEIKNYTDLAENYVNLAGMYKDLPNWQKAREVIAKAIIYADSSKNKNTLSVAYETASKLEEEQGNTKLALDFFKKAHKSKIEAIENLQEVEIKRLENNYTVAQKEKELAVVKTDKAKQALVQSYLIAGIVTSMLVLGIVIIIVRVRMKRAHDEQVKLEKELEYKNKELTSYALNFIQKNELIENFSEKIDEIKKQAEGSIVNELNRAKKLLDDNNRIDNEWENFKRMFEEVHKGFFIAIKEKYPDIGNSELRLCALLRLNMNLKESSRILGISSDSVKTARYRLRKKLGLATEDNLVDFLIRFDQKMVA